MLVKVRAGCGGIDLGFDWHEGTVHEVECVWIDRRCFKLVGAPKGTLFSRSSFIEGEPIDAVWLECVDDDSDSPTSLIRGCIYPCLDVPRLRNGGGVNTPARPGFYFTPSRFKEVPYPHLETPVDVWRDITAGEAQQPHKTAMMAFFKKPSHDDLCGSCGAPRPCRYHD